MLKQENSFLPFSTSECPRGPWLIFAPHADDETYGMGGAILRAKSIGLKTHLVVMTDGALGGEASNLIDIRRQEVEAAAQELGISTIDCWTEEDRGLKIKSSLITRILDKVLRARPASVFFPSPMEPHPDHRVTTLLVWSALQMLPADKRPNAYSYEISVQSPINMLLDITEQSKQKGSVMRIYASQNSQNNYEDLVSALDKARTFSLPCEVEYAEGFYSYNDKQLQKTLSRTLSEIIAQYLV